MALHSPVNVSSDGWNGTCLGLPRVGKLVSQQPACCTHALGFACRKDFIIFIEFQKYIDACLYAQRRRFKLVQYVLTMVLSFSYRVNLFYV